MTREDCRELAEMYLAPEAAELLILRACDRAAPELAQRAAYALRWLNPCDIDPRHAPQRGAADELAEAVATLARATILDANRQTRVRCARLLEAVMREAAGVSLRRAA